MRRRRSMARLVAVQRDIALDRLERMADMNDLLLELDIEARQRARALELNNKLPQGFVEEHYPLSALEQMELRRLVHALSAAQDADTFVALARGQAVHPSRLNPVHERALRR